MGIPWVSCWLLLLLVLLLLLPLLRLLLQLLLLWLLLLLLGLLLLQLQLLHFGHVFGPFVFLRHVVKLVGLRQPS